MADIDQIIAGGAGASSRADFSGIPKLLDSYWAGLDQRAKNDLRDAFKPTADNPNGVPMKDGQPDWGEVTKTFFQKGAPEQGISAANLGLNQQNIQQNRNAAIFAATGKSPEDTQQPQAKIQPTDAPSPSRSIQGQVAPALNKGGAQDQGGETPKTYLAKQGLQPGYKMEVALAYFKRNGIDPDQPFNPNDPKLAKLQPVMQRLGSVGQVQPPQPGDGQPPQQTPQAPPQVAQAPMQPPQGVPQGQPAAQTQQSPFANAVSAGLIPSGVDPVRYVAGLKYRAAALPKGPAQESIQSQVNAIDKATELTSGQKDFAAAQANPKLNEFQNQIEADKASAVARAGNDVKEQQAYIDNGKVAQARLGTLNTISNIISTDKNLNLGFGSESTLKIKMAAEKLGFDVGDLSGAQIIQKLNGVLASESTKSLATRPTQFEFKTFLGNNPGLALDEKGNVRMLGILQQNAKREADLGKLARSNQGNWDNWDNVVEAYDKKNPIKDPTTGNILSNHSIIAPGPSKAATPASAVPKLEVGKTMVNGKVFKGGNPNDKANWELRS